jgi:hypothetical protein
VEGAVDGRAGLCSQHPFVEHDARLVRARWRREPVIGLSGGLVTKVVLASSHSPALCRGRHQGAI